MEKEGKDNRPCLRPDWRACVTDKEFERSEQIVNTANAMGKLSRKDGLFLVEYDKKTRVCNTCGRTLPLPTTKEKMCLAVL